MVQLLLFEIKNWKVHCSAAHGYLRFQVKLFKKDNESYHFLLLNQVSLLT